MTQTITSGQFVPLPNIAQQTEEYCGPAMIQLLLARLNRQVSQDEVVRTAGVVNSIQEYGTNPNQLADAVIRLFPDLTVWLKEETTWVDLDYLLHRYNWPVGVNWQGLFYDTPEEEARDNPNGEHGHYSVITDINLKNRTITIKDPYPEFSTKTRVFDLDWFAGRWWDTNEIINPEPGQSRDLSTHRLIMLLTSAQANFPKAVGMKKYSR